MTGSEWRDVDQVMRIARRIEDILEQARERERQGQTLALDVDARFRLEDVGAVQFQIATAILQETAGLRQEEVVAELLVLGLASVLRGAAQVMGQAGVGADGEGELLAAEPPRADGRSTVPLLNDDRIVN